MHIGLLCPELYGHLNPLTSLGVELVRRGHRVTLFAPPSAAGIAQRQSIELAAIGKDEDVDGDLMGRWRRLGELGGLAAMRETGRVLFDSARIVRRDLPPLLRELLPDGLIVDQFSPAGVVVAQQQQVPFVIACNALAAHWDWRPPPPPLLWKFHDNWFGRLRNGIARWIIPPIYNRFARAAEVGVKPLMLVFEQQHGLAHIAQQPEFFDFPRDRLPEHFHYTAPWHRADRDDHVPFPWERLDGRPLVYASMGTLQNRLRPVFDAILSAAKGLPAQVVLTLGGSGLSLDAAIPENVVLVPHAPQLRLLERSAAAITHAGLNTVLECISRGVPMVCLPVTNDQPGVARRAEWLGMAEVLNVHRVTPDLLRASVLRVLNEPHYAVRTNHFRQQTHNGLATAAQIVERAFSTRAKVPRECCPASG